MRSFELTVEELLDPKSAVGGRVKDVYREDCATVDQVVTPWKHSLARDPHYNKGLEFTEHERDAHYLRGLLPPTFLTQELQEENEKLLNPKLSNILQARVEVIISTY